MEALDFDVGTGKELFRPPATELAATGPLSPSEVDFFFREGYVIARGLLSATEIAQLREGAKEADTFGSVHGAPYDKLKVRLAKELKSQNAFRKISVSSVVVSAVAQVLPSPKGVNDIHVVNDAYFKMADEDTGCGFHVDDIYFWPCPRDAPGPGVNAWIPLDEVGTQGGGLVLAPGSHTADFLDIREAIKFQTCDLQTLHPEGQARLDAIAITPQFQLGDVLLCTRFLFHRGDPFKPDAGAVKATGLRRYSIRYMPGDAPVNSVLLKDGKVIVEDGVPLRGLDDHKYPAVAIA